MPPVNHKNIETTRLFFISLFTAPFLCIHLTNKKTIETEYYEKTTNTMGR
jgi:phage-related protein